MVTLFVAAFVLIIGYYYYPERELPPRSDIDRIVVFKSKRKMEVYSSGKLLKTYTISLGKNPIGAKEYEGDFKTPEGTYTIDTRNINSTFHKNLGVSYPNEHDVAHATRLGKPAGGAIKIHGLRNGIWGYLGKYHRFADWTAGCIAVTNPEIDELFEAVRHNAILVIHP